MRPNTKNIRKEIRAITKHRVGTRAESVPERLELLKAEKQPTGCVDDAAAARLQRVTYVPSMHRKHSSNGGRVRGRNSGALHRQLQNNFQSEWSQSVS